MLKQEVADKLTELISPMKDGRILEIGTGWGESAAFFSKLKPKWKIYTIDAYGLFGDGRIYPDWSPDRIKKVLTELPANVIQILGDSSKVPWELPIKVLFIDGDHTYQGCMSDFKAFVNFVEPGGIICLDDLTQENNPANGVRRALKTILSYSKSFHLIHRGYYCAILKKL